MPGRDDQVVEPLDEAGILRDNGIAWSGEGRPESLDLLALKNVWSD